MIQEAPDTHNEQQAKKRLRKRIRCEMCSTPAKEIFHSWKRAEGTEFKPGAEDKQDR
jgi:hypothetical protein